MTTRPGSDVDPAANTVAGGDLSAASAEAGVAAATLTGAALPRPAPGAPPTALPGQCFAHFRIDNPLGRGGMGNVYLANDVALDRPVALKLLKREVAQNPQFRQRFIREARAQARLSHANVCHIYFIGEQDDQLFFAMEYVEGENLQQRLERLGKLPADEALEYVRMAALGLREAHAHGFTHRDVKPSNLLLDRHGVVKVVDFGIVKEKEKDKHRIDAGLTQDGGGIVGTPLYMAPEQARGEPVDHRADIYALGATLHHLVSGAPPFEGDTPLAIISKHLTDPRPRLAQQARKAKISRVDELVDRMMAKRPAERFADYDELIGAIEEISARISRPAGFWVRAAALALDCLVVSLLIVPLGITADYLRLGVIDNLLFPFTAAIYSMVCHGRWGRTAGKALLEIEVVRSNGTPPGWLRAALRWLLQWGPTYLAAGILGILDQWNEWQGEGWPAHDLIGLIVLAVILIVMLAPLLGGALRAAFAEGKRAPWDRWSGTQVRYRRSDLTWRTKASS